MRTAKGLMGQKMKYKAIVLLTAVVLAAVGSNAAKASLIGDTVHLTYRYTDFSTVFEDFGTFVITGSNSFTLLDGNSSISFGASAITITNETAGAFSPASFSGYDVQLVSGPAFSNVTINPSSSSAFVPGTVLAFSGSEISLNMQGTCSDCGGGESIVLDVTTAIPEPSTWALMLLGFAGLGFVGYRRARPGAIVA
jgi:hypothetical protein